MRIQLSCKKRNSWYFELVYILSSSCYVTGKFNPNPDWYPIINSLSDRIFGKILLDITHIFYVENIYVIYACLFFFLSLLTSISYSCPQQYYSVIINNFPVIAGMLLEDYTKFPSLYKCIWSIADVHPFCFKFFHY